MKLLTRRGLLRATGFAAPAILLRPAMAQFDSCLPGICGRGISGWQTAFSQSLTADNGGWNGFNLRQVFNASVLGFSGSKVRITVDAGHAVSGFTIDHAEIGNAAGAGDAYDFDGSQVALTFSGGSASLVAALGSTTVSDEMTYTFDKTKNFIVAVHFNAASVIRSTNPVSNVQGYFKSAANEVSTSDVTGYSTGASNLHLVSKIEVFV